MKALSPESYSAIEDICYDYDLGDLRAYMSPEWVSWLAWILRCIPDNDKYFPRGKWATIQRIQGWLEKESERHVDETIMNRGKQ